MMRRLAAALAVFAALASGVAYAAPPQPAYVTGSPATGAIAKMSGPQSVTSGDLSGDCSSSGTLATICLKTNGVSYGYFATGTDAANLTGTLALARLGSQSANVVLAGPTSGGSATPGFRALVGADLPNLSIVAGENLSAGDLVFVQTVAGVAKAVKANATDNQKPAVGFVVASVASGATAAVYPPGALDTAVSGLTPGGGYYLSTSGGAVTLTAPTTGGNISQEVGWAADANTLVFTPKEAFRQ